MRVVKSADGNGAPKPGGLLIFATQALMHAPVGRLVDPKSAWPSDQLLQLTGMALPVGPASFMSAPASSNPYGKSGSKLDVMASDALISLEGVTMCKIALLPFLGCLLLSGLGARIRRQGAKCLTVV